jgi:hypothetical protein
MKTKEEIINHVHNVGYGKKAMKEICAFMVGAGLKEKAEVIQFKIGEGSFNDFYEWYKTKSWRKVIHKLINAFDKPQFKVGDWIRDKPQFKVGDWIRDKATNVVMQIGYIWENAYISPDFSGSIFFENAIKYEPKDGEFYTQEKDEKGNYLCVGCNSYLYNTFKAHLWNNYSREFDSKERKYRPSTEREIKFLKDEVKKTFHQEWNGKEWVDIKPTFKKGDYISVRGKKSNSDHLIIVENVDNDMIGALAYYCKYDVCKKIKYNIFNCGSLSANKIYLSTPEEIKEMDEALARDGKYFDKKTLEIKDLLKEGDIVIVWDNNNKRAIICVYTLSLKNAWKNIVRFESIEQYKKILKGEI